MKALTILTSGSFVWLACGGSALARVPPERSHLDDEEPPIVAEHGGATDSANDSHTSLSVLFEPLVPIGHELYPQLGARYTRHFSAHFALDATVVSSLALTTLSVGPRWYFGGPALKPYVFAHVGGMLVTVPAVESNAWGVLAAGGGLEYAAAPLGFRAFLEGGWTVNHQGDNYGQLAVGIGYRF